MNSNELEAVHAWAAYYRQQFHLPAEERGGYVLLPVTHTVGIVHVPMVLADRVMGSMRARHCSGPVLARHIRRTFVAAVDYLPGREVMEALSGHGVCIPVAGTALMLPTGLGRWTREGAYWVEQPRRDKLLPPLSTVVTATLESTGRATPSSAHRR
ncbi:hypothetical protein [Nocardia cyriacigeorgica]|uniref:hypothetical protein n=1 Tax=Nocardia cyriacigeorgica TaxID=135487 RepID=UPI0018943299|nr:hypothetical protein [Nocardia cyriacigeorgica]MBF6437427.1 hypothetical protein [Nocardia cyriacigeorgica]MBF6452996.1 hypothetical protein [Nocardia cyriacigeorgica]MBF6550165.1 hypothetical protein [Nocardia cyriacigeorgica]